MDRSTRTLLATALGDAFGRPLEFVRSGVRTHPAGPGHDFVWTDDTHMSLYVAQALRAHGPGPLREEAFATALGEAFSAWLDDPRTPTTAPGNTCLAGARRWRRTRDWRSSGVPHSDGCGAVMRVAPLALRFRGAELDRAAEISARLTHGHPGATQAAIAACRLLAALLDGAPLTARLVAHIADGVVGDTRAALLAAVRLAPEPAPWLEEQAVPAHDGGWRSPSALGLAVLAALRWGGPTAAHFATAVEKAARIAGDSDSVAAICGMLLGATGAELPPRWLDALPDRALVEEGARVHRESPIVAVADLHGHPHLLRGLIARMDDTFAHWTLVTLGDYVDNGPDIPGLLELLLQLEAERGERFVPILGNHDLACLRALGWPGDTPDPRWYRRWSGRYWGWRGGLGSTAQAYGASDAHGLRRAMPVRHQAFLHRLPWFAERAGFFFVHAGLQRGPIGPQRRALAARQLPAVHEHTPPQLRDKSLATVEDPDWEQVVVSAHTKLPGGESLVRPRRICLSGDVERTGVLRAIVLPSREVVGIR